MPHEQFLAHGETLGRRCVGPAVAALIADATEYARLHCRLTGPVPAYDDDPDREYRCTPEEYDLGDRESHTPHAHRCRCRHRHTNYDALIGGLDRDTAAGRVYYEAIRARADELVEAELDRLAEAGWG